MIPMCLLTNRGWVSVQQVIIGSDFGLLPIQQQSEPKLVYIAIDLDP